MRHDIYKTCKVAISSKDSGIVFDYPEKMNDDNLVDGIWVDDFFTSTKDIPSEKGVYQCDVDVKYWEPAYPDFDGDIEIIPINIKKLL